AHDFVECSSIYFLVGGFMENQEKQYKRLIAALEGLELTESETSTLKWLSGWDYIAINDIISLFKKCRSER
ncbi:hypothetical protein, partial [Enterocloster lavalensis]|uniref:hypothetical protein n=3 Tax=Enterocloster lavalensis TaxID=460384 RepID=UPI0034A47446